MTADATHFNVEKFEEEIKIIPVGTGSSWDTTFREIGNILYEPSDTGKEYKHWYSGYAGSYVGNDVYVGFAYSRDGVTWIKAGKIITRALEDPYVINVGGTYYLYAEDKADVPFRNIRLFTSTNLTDWTDQGDVFDVQSGGNPNNWEATDVSSPIVWKEGATWYMLYEGRGGGYSGKIGLATSTNGLTWVRSGSNPVFDVGNSGEWDSQAVVCDDIIKIGNTYVLSYHAFGTSWQRGFAYSENLTDWRRYEKNPLMSEWDLMFFQTSPFKVLVGKPNGNYLFDGRKETKEGPGESGEKEIRSLGITKNQLNLIS